MSRYQISPAARNDLNSILNYQYEEWGAESASDLSELLFSTFERLANVPGLGHLRTDLTPKPYYFHLAAPYFIVYMRQVDPLPIIAILHTSRNLRKLLRKR